MSGAGHISSVLAGLLLFASCTSTLAPSALPTPMLIAAPPGPAKAQIMAVHGFNDHRTAFAGFAAYAADRGIRVMAYDQQGFGESANLGLWPGRERLVEDLVDRLETAHAERPDLPLYLLGESMGGAVSIVTLAEHPDLPVEGVILSAPAVWGGDAMNPFYRAVLWFAARIAPGWKLSGQGLGKLASDNIDMLRALRDDPLYIKDTRIDAIEGVVGLMRDARNDGPALQLPRLVLGGARDEIIPPEAYLSFVASLHPKNCIGLSYPDGWHLLLRDLQRRTVWKDIVDWIDNGHVLSPRPDMIACGKAVTPASGRSGPGEE
ncbi:MAG: alpha/beta hydrolase [Geminicoccaceae bacterium]